MLKRAPQTFIVGFVVLGCLIGWTEYSFIFKEDLSRKDDVIRTKDSLITTLQDELSAAQSQTKAPPHLAPQISPPPNGLPRTTGAATTHGAQSPANSGNGNSTTYGTAPPKVESGK
jgi:hypothetical protein